ncbi:hypothetical protein E2L07_17860 [Halalkalibacterium halodurans]|uniref:hypothetical protein n=1 Tax=Halalkalibacterium halodurans TaxID=86665 RepID=UPI00106883DA|nr:hypothetical protein [Halalkalibacterium halodurans]TES48949.1 hypothetical protein E2L07_17860 [Halalkalibacterium halodurans]
MDYAREKEKWYKQFMGSSVAEQYTLVMDLLRNQPDDEMLINDDFGIILVDLKEGLFRRKRFDDTIELIDVLKVNTPQFYAEEVNYLSDAPIQYYLYKNDIEKVREYFQAYIGNPSKAPEVFIHLFNKLLLYKQTDLAIEIAEAVWRKIAESPDLIYGAEGDFKEAIINQEFQEYYLSLLSDSGNSDVKLIQMKKKFEGLNVAPGFLDKSLPLALTALKRISEREAGPVFEKKDWDTHLEAAPSDAVYQLSWAFAAYMLFGKKIPFTASLKIWREFLKVLTVSKAGGVSFDLNTSDFKQETGDLLTGIGTGETGFMLLWGLPYIYDFLEQEQLIAQDVKQEALNTIQAGKNDAIKYYSSQLWRFNFVHVWEKPDCITEEEFTGEKAMFRETFTSPPEMDDKPAFSNFNGYLSSESKSLFDNAPFGNKSGSKRKGPSKKQKTKKRKDAKKQRRKNR